jgi:ankyrin repeat protein
MQRLDGGYVCGYAGSSAMDGIWRAAEEGDVGEVERLLGHDLGLLEARDDAENTPLICAAVNGHLETVRFLLDKGAAINASNDGLSAALWMACTEGETPVVRLLLERGADPTLASDGGYSPLMAASEQGHLEVVRQLLGHPSAKTTINRPDDNDGWTALWCACHWGRGGS